MIIRLLTSLVVLALSTSTAAPLPRSGGDTPGAGYSWAGACRPCHEPIYQAWSRTKHASALGRLSAAEQEQACVGCHVTGATTRLVTAGNVLNAGVQCEACHGAAAAHVTDPQVRTGLVRKPAAAVCEACHSEKGPHFKGFWYDAMAGLSHRIT